MIDPMTLNNNIIIIQIIFGDSFLNVLNAQSTSIYIINALPEIISRNWDSISKPNVPTAGVPVPI